MLHKIKMLRTLITRRSEMEPRCRESEGEGKRGQCERERHDDCVMDVCHTLSVKHTAAVPEDGGWTERDRQRESHSQTQNLLNHS